MKYLVWLLVFASAALGQTSNPIIWSGTNATDLTSGGILSPRIFIDGATDVVQSTVQGHSAQTSNLFLVEQSGGTDLMAVSNTAGTQIRGTDGTVDAAAGYVGETFVDSSSTNFTTSAATVSSRTLQPGKWLITATSTTNTGAAAEYISLSISTTTNTHTTATRVYGPRTSTSGVAGVSTTTIVLITSATTYYLVGNSGTANVTGTESVTRGIYQRIF